MKSRFWLPLVLTISQTSVFKQGSAWKIWILSFFVFSNAQLSLLSNDLESQPPSTHEQIRLLQPESFKHWVDGFNKNDNELYQQYVPNSAAWEF